jgi:hypothetical protein
VFDHSSYAVHASTVYDFEHGYWLELLIPDLQCSLCTGWGHYIKLNSQSQAGQQLHRLLLKQVHKPSCSTIKYKLSTYIPSYLYKWLHT